MKKIIYSSLIFFCLVSPIVIYSQHADDWIHYGEQRFNKINFDLYAKRGSWGMGQQFYAANFYNGTSYKVKVEGEFYAKLICGNEVVSNLSFTVDAYGDRKKVDPASPNNGFLSDNTGLINSADDNACKGNEISVKSDDNQRIFKTHARIHSLGVRKLKLTAIYSDGTEAQISDNGELIESNSNASKRVNSQQNYSQNQQRQNNNNYSNNQYNQNNSSNNQNNNNQQQQERWRQQQLVEQRRQQTERINEANRQTGEAWQNAFSGLGDITDMIMQNMFRNSIQSDNQSRQQRFNELQQLVETKAGTLSNCNQCSGQGYATCGSCSGSGKKTCMGCYGKGTTNCSLCSGTGTFVGNTCGSCGGKGSFECAICKGSGNSYCTDCHATGKQFCIYCHGTGQEFKEDFRTKNTYNSEPLNYSSNSYSNTKQNVVTNTEKTVAAVKATFEKIWTDFDITQNQSKGMLIHIKFSVNNMLHMNGTANAYFYNLNGEPLKDTNGLYRTVTNSVVASTAFTPGYESAEYNDLAIFIPYLELHCTQKGKNDLKFFVELFYQDASNQYQGISSSEWQSFSLTNQ